MKNIKSIIAASAIGLAASSAQAITTIDTVPTSADSFEIRSQWNSTPTQGTLDIASIGFNFDLTLVAYGNQPGTIAPSFFQTGYFLDGPGGRLTTETTACNGAGGVFVGGCNLITSTTPDGTVLFSNLAAGDYTFGLYDSATPEFGFLTLAVSKVAPVPLPAAGLLLLSALGGAAALRRRRKA